MKTAERLSCGVGNVFNDLYRQLLLSFEILFFMKVVQVSASQTGLIILIGQIADALISPLTGYLGDRVNVPLLSSKIGRRKSWHLVATVLMAIVFPLLLNRCFLCDGRDQSLLLLVYYSLWSALTNLCYNMVEINHLAFISTVAEKVEECTALSAVRTVFTFLSGVYVYVIVWAVLGQDSGDSIGPKSLQDFAHLCWIVTGTGIFFAAIFYIGTKEPKKRARVRRSTMTYMDFMNSDGLLTGVLEMGGNKSKSRKKDARRTIMADVFVELLMASSYNKTVFDEGQEVTEEVEHRKRKKSFLQKFVAAVFNDEEAKAGHNTTHKTEEAVEEPQNKESGDHLVLELHNLDRDRRKSFVVRVIDGLLSRLDHSQQEISTVNFEHQVAVNSAHGEYETGAQEAPQDEVKKDTGECFKKFPTIDETTELAIGRDDSADVSISAKYRNQVDVPVTIDGKLGVPNFEFSEDVKKEELSNTSVVHKTRKSVAFSLPETPAITQIDEKTANELQLDDPLEKKVIMTGGEEMQIHVQQQPTDTDVHDNAGSPPIIRCSHAKKRPKTVKDWLTDPDVYKVAVIFTCSRLVQDAVYAYLPLFLTERLQFAKEAIAYFPLVLLISASIASTFCEKLNKKIGTKWSYLLAASLVMSGTVWSYFQTPSTRQTTYAPVVIIGSGMSIMYVMALAFITELIGENKETSGSVISIITLIARLSSGGLIIGIQGFYPAQMDTDSNEAISSYVQHVFAMAPGILTLVGFLTVLLFQPSVLSCRNKAPRDNTDAQAEEDDSPPYDVLSQFTSKHAEIPSVSTDANQSTDMAVVHSYPEDTKL
ncbi:hypothetical protein ACROYT_G002191 [Oculina patagonica]